MENMSDDEFDLLDQLYFVQAFDEIQNDLNWERHRLIPALISLHKAGYIKILNSPDKEYVGEIGKNAEIAWDQMYFLATKKGLLFHHGF